MQIKKTTWKLFSLCCILVLNDRSLLRKIQHGQNDVLKQNKCIFSASVYGQGHVTTFTGFKYRMYGPGDYVLATLNNTVIQGQFKRNPVPTESKLT